MDTLSQDIRQGFRALRRAKRLTTAALATLALGIGATTAIFTVVNAMLFRPLPYPDASRLLWVSETYIDGTTNTISWPTLRDWRRDLTSFESFAGSKSVTFTLTGVGQAMRLSGRQVSWDFFQTLQVAPALGRQFTIEDDRPAPVHPIIVSDTLWRGALGQDEAVVGRRLSIDGVPHEIVGVMPRGFRYTSDYAIYEPLGVFADLPSFLDRGSHQGLFGVGRLKPGVTEEAARHELDALAARIAQEYPKTNTGLGAHVEPLARRILGDLRPSLIVLMSAVSLLLLIACINVANLLIAHGATRRHEMAIRAALGAGRRRLTRQLLVESAILSVAGGALGLATAWGLLRALLAVAPSTLPRLDEVQLDWQSVLCAVGITALASLIFGVVPAAIASAAGGQQIVTRAGRHSAAASPRVRRALLIAEVAFAVILLCGAGLLVRTMWRLDTADPGFSPGNLISLKYAIKDSSWTDARIQRFHEDVIERTRAVPGVASAGLTLSLPIEGSQFGSVFSVTDRPAPPRAQLPDAAFMPISPGFLETMGLHVLAGRVLTADDGETAPPVAVVSEALAQRFWPGQSALGKTFKQGWPDGRGVVSEIVGVVNDIKLDGVENPTQMQIYRPLAQMHSKSIVILARISGQQTGVAAAIRDVVANLEPNLPVYDVRTMDDVMAQRLARRRLSMTIFTVFGGVALLLAAVGLYGVVSHGVADRTREIGVRLALGATSRQVRALFVRQGAQTTAIGIAAGTVAALLLSTFMREMLFEIAPTDPLTIAAVVTLLSIVAMAACYLPARRATRVSPTIALRGDESEI